MYMEGLRTVCLEQSVGTSRGPEDRKVSRSHDLHLKLAPSDFSVGIKGRMELGDHRPRKALEPPR